MTVGDLKIIFGRARGRCECEGGCGEAHEGERRDADEPGDGRCRERARVASWRSARVELRVVEFEDGEVAALCPACRERRAARTINDESGQGLLWRVA